MYGGSPPRPRALFWRCLGHDAGVSAWAGLRGATIRTIQIAVMATHKRYAVWSKWPRSDAFQTRIISSTISLGRPITRRRLWDCLILLYQAKPGRNPSM